jgi:outer membrane lipoprotein-sorting protein
MNRAKPTLARPFLAAMIAVLLCIGDIDFAAAQTPDQIPSPAAALTAEDRADIARVETYLENMGTLKARFLQIAPDGTLTQGMIYIARPDKLRVEYDGDVPFLIVATGKLLVLYDGELQQTSYLPLHSSPASVLIQERVDLSDEMNVSEIERAPGVLRLKLVEREDPAKGAIYLTFADPPLRLREWTVIDAEGQATQVALVNSEFGLDLDPVLFMYAAPGPDQYSQ